MNNKKLFAFLILGVFLLAFAPMVSAVQKSYDPNTRTITLNNNFLFINTGTIAEVQLLTPLNYKVGLGYQKVAEMKVTGFKDYTDFITQMEFYDTKDNMKQFTREFDLKKKEIVQVSVDDYECSEQLTTNSTNNTMETVCVVNGNHLEDREVWTKLHRVDFKKLEVLIIAMFTNVELDDRVEWIPTIAGKEITEFAVWTADLNTDLISYLKFDNNLFTDSLGNYDATNFGTTNTTGKIIDGRNYNGVNQYTSQSIPIDLTKNQHTINIWAKLPVRDDNYVIYEQSDGTNRFLLWLDDDVVGESGDDWIRVYANTHVGTIHYVLTDSNWHMYTVVFDNNNMELYADGVSMGSTAFTGITRSSNLLEIGHAGVSPLYTPMIADEFSVWERNLNSTEININLWNSGNGNSYTNVFGTNPTVTAISPANDTTSIISPITQDFTCYGSDGENFTEMEFYWNGALDQSNSSGLNNTNYVFSKTLTDGDYNWTCIGYDDEANTGTFTARTYSVDTTPFIEITNPTTNQLITINSVTVNVTLTETYFNELILNLNYTNGTLVNTTIITDSTRGHIFTSLSDGNYTIEAKVSTTTGKSNSTSVNFLLHTGFPVINITSPIGISPFIILGDNITLIYSISEEGENTTEHIVNCFYTYNNTNTSIDCNGTLVEFEYIYGNNILNITAIDIFGATTIKNTTFRFDITELNTSFINTVLELSTQTFEYFFRTPFNIISTQFNYNGTSYTANIFDNGTEQYKLISTIQVPLVSLDTNFTLNFGIQTNNNGLINSTELNQTVMPLTIDNCSVNNFTLITSEIFDERDLSNITADIEISFELFNPSDNSLVSKSNNGFVGVHSFSACSNVNISEIDLLYDLEIRYSQPGVGSSFNYVPEFYHIQKASSSTFPQTINLYDLNQNESTEFTIFYRDDNYVIRANVLFQILREYVNEGLFRTVEIPISSSEGSAIAHFDLSNYKYKIIVTENGNILNIFDNPAIVCESEISGICTLTLKGEKQVPVAQGITELNDFQYTATQTNESIDIIFSSPTGTNKQVRIIMVQSSPFADDIIICDRSVLSSSGSVSCDTVQTIGDSSVSIIITSNNVTQAYLEAFVEEDLSSSFLLDNYFIGALLLILLMGMGISSPQIMIWIGVFGLVVLGALFLLKSSSVGLAVGAIVWFITAAIIATMKINRRTES